MDTFLPPGHFRPSDALTGTFSASPSASPSSTQTAGLSLRAPGRDALPTMSCIVPSFNEAASLRDLLPRLSDVLQLHCSRWEILVVDDGSQDDSAEVLRQLASQPRLRGLKVIRLSRNFGKEAALSAGLVQARGDVVMMLDADLQHDPALIPEFLDAWRRGGRHGLRGAPLPRGRERPQAHRHPPLLRPAQSRRALRGAARCRRLPPDGPPCRGGAAGPCPNATGS